MPIIEVSHVTKEFRLGQLQGLKQTAMNGLRRLAGQSVETKKPFIALDNVSFTVEEGEVLGIIGHNGAGKSTLLKLLANISKPTSGNIKVRGRIAPLIEVGAGLIGDLTGRENVYLNGILLGMSRQEIKRKFDDIVAFAELEEFIDTPIKRYSSGMQVRLGFAIATSVEAGILIVDEVLAVGDLTFQRKCFDRIEEKIKRQGNTVLLVSHNIRQVERLCQRTIMLDHGHIFADGPPKAVCGLFYEQSDQKIMANVSNANASRASRIFSTDEVRLVSVSILNRQGQDVDKVVHGDDVTISVLYEFSIDVENVTFGVGLHTTDFIYIADRDSCDDGITVEKLSAGMHRINCTIRKFPLLSGIYSLRLGVNGGAVENTFFLGEGIHPFQVAQDSNSGGKGLIGMKTEWWFDNHPDVIKNEQPSYHV